jgi:5-methylthioadenosine/S-adenosylhomocysteine deaminase
MQTINQLVHAKWIITCEDNNRVLEHHAIAIQDGKILDILPSTEAAKKYQAQTEQHFKTHAITPGLINAHSHIAMNVFRGLADDLALMDWLSHHIWPAEAKWVSDEMVYDASLMAMAEMIRCGTTCFNDMYFYPEATAKAAELAGMRAFIGMTIIDVPTNWAKNAKECFAKSHAFLLQYEHHALITPTFAPHSTYTVSIEDLAKINALADDYNLKINIHLQESKHEVDESLKKHGKRPLQRLHDIGMVSPRLIAIHMTDLNNDDFTILEKTRPNIVHCPESNMKLASGMSPVQRLLNLPINVALGTDGAASNNDLDMISEMRSAAFLGKIATYDPKAVSAETALKMATLHGAKALGIDHLTGSLSIGKSADFISIDLEQIETEPLYHPISQIVYAASRHQVTDVFVAGKQLLKNRQLTTLNEKEILEKAQSWGKRIKS